MVHAVPRKVFEGFSHPQDVGFTRLPNDWLDELAQIDNLAELKIILYLARHSWGFQEYDQWKKITTDEFMNGRRYGDGTRMDNGTGLSEMSVRHGLHKAIEQGYILLGIDQHDKARKKLYYKLKMKAPKS